MQNTNLLIFMLVYALCSGCGRGDTVAPPEAKINPHASERQRFVVHVTGQVNQVAGMQGRVQYDIANKSCIPVDYGRALGGVTPDFTMFSIVKFVPTENGQYDGLIYRDLYESSDYYGLGICKWSLTAIKIDILAPDGGRRSVILSGGDLDYSAHANAACGPKVGGFGCAEGRAAASVDAAYKLSIISRKE